MAQILFISNINAFSISRDPKIDSLLLGGVF